MSAPEKIYIQWHGDADPADFDGHDPDGPDVTWCADQIYKHDIVYIRADKVDALEAERDLLKQEIFAVREWHGNALIERDQLRAELAECREDAENWRMMRRQLGDLIDAAEAGERSVIGACATYIAVCANDVGADNAKFDMDGVTDSAGTECGDWVVTVTRKGEGG